MTEKDRDQFLTVLSNLDAQIDDAILDANGAPMVAQIGNLAKAVLLSTTLALHQQPPALCICCDRPADPTLPGDLDLCPSCFNAISAPMPAELEELWLP